MGKKVELEGLSDAEKKAILEVIQRDYSLRNKEKERVKQLQTEILPLETAKEEDGEGDETAINPDVCHICGSKFIWLIRPKAECGRCGKFACRNNENCSTKKTTTTDDEVEWMCKICSEKTAVHLKSSQWFYVQIASKFRRHAGAKIVRELHKESKLENASSGINSVIALSENQDEEEKILESTTTATTTSHSDSTGSADSIEDEEEDVIDEPNGPQTGRGFNKHTMGTQETLYKKVKEASSSEVDKKEGGSVNIEIVEQESEETGYVTEEKDSKEKLEETLTNILLPKLEELKTSQREQAYQLAENVIEKYIQHTTKEEKKMLVEAEGNEEIMSRYLRDHKQNVVLQILKTIEEPGKTLEQRMTAASSTSASSKAQITMKNEEEEIEGSEINSSLQSAEIRSENLLKPQFRASIINRCNRSKTPIDNTRTVEGQDGISVKDERIARAEIESIFTEIVKDSSGAGDPNESLTEFNTEIEIDEDHKLPSPRSMESEDHSNHGDDHILKDGNWEVQRKPSVEKPNSSQKFLPHVEAPSAYEGLHSGSSDLTTDSSGDSDHSSNSGKDKKVTCEKKDAAIQTFFEGFQDAKDKAMALKIVQKMELQTEVGKSGKGYKKSHMWSLKLKPQRLDEKLKTPSFSSIGPSTTKHKKSLGERKRVDSMDLFEHYIMNRSLSSSSTSLDDKPSGVERLSGLLHNKNEEKPKEQKVARAKSSSAKRDKGKHKAAMSLDGKARDHEKMYSHFDDVTGDPTEPSNLIAKIDAEDKVKAWIMSSSSSIDTCASDLELPQHSTTRPQLSTDKKGNLMKMRSLDIPQVTVIETMKDKSEVKVEEKQQQHKQKSVAKQTSVFDQWGVDNGLNYEYKIEAPSSSSSSSYDGEGEESFIDLVSSSSSSANDDKREINQLSIERNLSLDVEKEEVNQSLNKTSETETSVQSNDKDTKTRKISLNIPKIVIMEKNKGYDDFTTVQQSSKQTKLERRSSSQLKREESDDASSIASSNCTQSTRNFSIRSFQRENRLEIQKQGRNIFDIIKELNNAGLTDGEKGRRGGVTKQDSTPKTLKPKLKQLSPSPLHRPKTSTPKVNLVLQKSVDSIPEEVEHEANELPTKYNEWARAYNFAREKAPTPPVEKKKKPSLLELLKADQEKLKLGTLDRNRRKLPLQSSSKESSFQTPSKTSPGVSVKTEQLSSPAKPSVSFKIDSRHLKAVSIKVSENASSAFEGPSLPHPKPQNSLPQEPSVEEVNAPKSSTLIGMFESKIRSSPTRRPEAKLTRERRISIPSSSSSEDEQPKVSVKGKSAFMPVDTALEVASSEPDDAVGKEMESGEVDAMSKSSSTSSESSSSSEHVRENAESVTSSRKEEIKIDARSVDEFERFEMEISNSFKPEATDHMDNQESSDRQHQLDHEDSFDSSSSSSGSSSNSEWQEKEDLHGNSIKVASVSIDIPRDGNLILEEADRGDASWREEQRLNETRSLSSSSSGSCEVEKELLQETTNLEKYKTLVSLDNIDNYIEAGSSVQIEVEQEAASSRMERELSSESDDDEDFQQMEENLKAIQSARFSSQDSLDDILTPPDLHTTQEISSGGSGEELTTGELQRWMEQSYEFKDQDQEEEICFEEDKSLCSSSSSSSSSSSDHNETEDRENETNQLTIDANSASASHVDGSFIENNEEDEEETKRRLFVVNI